MTAKATMSLLCTTAALFVFEEYVLWGLATLPLLWIICSQIHPRNNKILLICSYILVATISFVIGLLYESNNVIRDGGGVWLLTLLPLVAFTSIRMIAADDTNEV